VKVTLQCTASGRNKSFCWLVVGCLNDDSLLLSRHIDIASVASPMELTAMLRSKIKGDLRIVAAVLSEKVIGGDTVTPVTYTISQQFALRQAHGRSVTTQIDLTEQEQLPESQGTSVPAHLEVTSSASSSSVHVTACCCIHWLLSLSVICLVSS
jgi:hypothetical protein